MSIKSVLSKMETVEDLFTALGVPYDSSVLLVHRTRILRRFGREMERIDVENQQIDEAQLRGLYATAIETIHSQCKRGMREPEPILRGLSQQLVQLRRGPSHT